MKFINKTCQFSRDLTVLSFLSVDEVEMVQGILFQMSNRARDLTDLHLAWYIMK